MTTIGSINMPMIPPGIVLVCGNHLEKLAVALTDYLNSGIGTRTADLFEPDIIMVQSKGMQRWVTLSVAKQNGICANLDFPFPNRFIATLYETLCGALPNKPIFDHNTLTFRILELLPSVLDQPGFDPIRFYLAKNQHPLKAYQLSRKIADVFDQYLIFRSDMTDSWEKGGNDPPVQGQSWQPILWRALLKTPAAHHRAQVQQLLLKRLNASTLDIGKLPRRMAVFGVSHLPLFHLRVLQALSRHIPVYFFLFNPCRQYWFDILSEKQARRLFREGGVSTADPADLHVDQGNRLLASWGQIGKQFFNTLYQSQDHITELFTDNTDNTLLGRLQQDILDLRELSAQPPEDNPKDTPLAAPDDSIRIHSCHSPMREIEVLHDQLLDMLEKHTDLHPYDILVLTPDIGLYAPYIHAVFDTRSPRLPFSIADQTLQREEPVVDSFIKFLAIIHERFEASKIMALLAYPSIRNCFGIGDRDLPLVEKWISFSDIRWGWEGSEKKKHGLPGFHENTWRFGLDRLLLGYVMAGDEQSLFKNLSPVNVVEGADSDLLGRLILFCSQLHHYCVSQPQSANLSRWGDYFTHLLNTFFFHDESTTQGIRQLREAINSFDEIEQAADCRVRISYDVALRYLMDRLENDVNTNGFLAGRITFCAMLPMRSIPAKVICLLGLNHDTFPGESNDPGFNLIALDPRPGDRSRRNDDKYLFLEALVSARKVLFLSYTGKSIQDNAPSPPSVLVEELIEYMVDHYKLSRDQLVLDHPLHAFSSRYFNDEKSQRLFSYNKDDLDSARQLSHPIERAPFFSEPLRPPDDACRSVELDQLIRFFSNPCRYLLEHRLGIYLYDTTQDLLDREAFVLSPLDRFSVNQRLLQWTMDGLPRQQSLALLRGSGKLPHGAMGHAAYQNGISDVREFSARLELCLPDEPPRSLQLTIATDRFQINAAINNVYSNCWVAYRMAKVRPRDLISFFLRHLLLCASREGETIQNGLFLFQDDLWSFKRPDRPEQLLASLLAYYWMGLRTPLPFFSRTSFDYAHRVINRSARPKDAIAAARRKWTGDAFTKGEKSDPYHDCCFRDTDPLNDRFEQIALGVWEPVFTHGVKQLADG